MDNYSPLVSILMPVYNGAEYIAETIESVCNQTLSDIELIIVDDGSVDDTAAVVKVLADKDARIKYYYQTNAGASSARNYALSLAQGIYLAVIDADDLWSQDRLEVQYKLALENEDCIIIGNVKRFTEEVKGIKEWGSETRLPPVQGDADYTRYLLSLNSYQMVAFNTFFGKTDIIRSCGGWNESLKSAEDWDYWIRLSLVARFYHVNTIFQFYRKHYSSITQTSNRFVSIKSHINIIDQAAITLNLSIFQKRKYKTYKYQEFISGLLYEKLHMAAAKYLMLSALHSNIFLTKDFYELIMDLTMGCFGKEKNRENHGSI